ncbi:MAG: hypothetical protein CL681_28950 [Blastopirellula sp.]|nr:hypothetical protein [Blastopirellula sp.]
MSYKQCVILLPCHSLEDFPTHHEGDDAQGLLAGWTALFHPGLIASSGSMPQWWRMDDPGEELAEHLLIIPSVSASELPTGFTQRAKDAGATLIRRKQDRDEILSLALQNCDNRYQQIDPELVADFLALGYAYLLIELLTRQMRYACNLDEVHFSDLIVAGAQAAVEGDHELAGVSNRQTSPVTSGYPCSAATRLVPSTRPSTPELDHGPSRNLQGKLPKIGTIR